MGWSGKRTGRQKKSSNPVYNWSLINKFREERKTTPEFELMLSSLSLEDIIALKLELAFRAVGNGLYGLPIIKTLPYICREAALKAAVSMSKSLWEAARMLDVDYDYFKRLCKRYEVKSYFSEKENLDSKKYLEYI